MLAVTITLSSLLLMVNSQYGYGAHPSYSAGSLPVSTENGQYGVNSGPLCDGTANSMCQNVYINSLEDFCLFAPPASGSQVGQTEAIEVAYCLQSGHGARPIPPGTIQAAHFIETPSYIQISGTGDFTKINVQAGDEGGELDPHGATGEGNPIGGVVFSYPLAGQTSILEWNSFLSATQFCIKVCKPAADDYEWCQHTFDVMGCEWNMPGNYGGGFDSCAANNADGYPGIYGTSTFSQGDGRTPLAHNAGATSQCNVVQTIGGGAAAAPAPVTSASSAMTSSSTAVSTTSTTTSSSMVTSTTSSSSVLSSSSLSLLPTSTSSATTSSSSSTTLSALPTSTSSTVAPAAVTISSVIRVTAASPSAVTPTTLVVPTPTIAKSTSSAGKIGASVGALILVAFMMTFA